MDTIDEISKALKAAREAKGLSQRALSHYLAKHRIE